MATNKTIITENGAQNMNTFEGVRLESMAAQAFADCLSRCKTMYQDAEKLLVNLLHSAAVSALCRQDLTQAQALCDELNGLDIQRVVVAKLCILFGGYHLTAAGKRISNPSRALYVRDTETGGWLQNNARGKAAWARAQEVALREYAHHWKSLTLKQIAVAAAEKPFDLTAFAAVVKTGCTSGRQWNDLQREDIKAAIAALAGIPAIKELLAEETITAVSRLSGKPGSTASV
jgi:hypothetical protein